MLRQRSDHCGAFSLGLRPGRDSDGRRSRAARIQRVEAADDNRVLRISRCRFTGRGARHSADHGTRRISRTRSRGVHDVLGDFGDALGRWTHPSGRHCDAASLAGRSRTRRGPSSTDRAQRGCNRAAWTLEAEHRIEVHHARALRERFATQKELLSATDAEAERRTFARLEAEREVIAARRRKLIELHRAKKRSMARCCDDCNGPSTVSEKMRSSVRQPISRISPKVLASLTCRCPDEAKPKFFSKRP